MGMAQDLRKSFNYKATSPLKSMICSMCISNSAIREHNVEIIRTICTHCLRESKREYKKLIKNGGKCKLSEYIKNKIVAEKLFRS